MVDGTGQPRVDGGISTRRAWRWLAVAVVLGLAAWAAWAMWLKPAPVTASGPNPWTGPVPVRVVPVGQQALAQRVRSIGTVTPLQVVTVRSRVDGLLARVLFTEGQEVKQGQLLAEIDARPFRVQLAQATGALRQNQAQLANAQRDLARFRALFEQDSIARQQLDSQEALVAQLGGSVQAAQAQVDDAALQLSFTRIEAPAAGRLGLRRVDAGNLVTASDSDGLVTITQTQPITALFTVPEQQLNDVRLAWRDAARTGGSLAVEAWDRTESQRLALGRLVTLDNQIDTATGTLRMKAQFDNRDEALFPNQFVNVRLLVRTAQDARAIPADAVQYGSRGTYVYVVEEGKARVREVALGTRDGEQVAVTSGLAPGERVVLEGLDRLREGADVVVVPDGQPPRTVRQLQDAQAKPASP